MWAQPAFPSTRGATSTGAYDTTKSANATDQRAPDVASRRRYFSKNSHGATTRSFHEGPVGSTFGAAGFTRHLLHHWDPALSYTNLAAVEQFLRGCAAIAPQALRKTTYWRAFRALYGRP